MIIVIEGNDGSGKKQVSANLAKFIQTKCPYDKVEHLDFPNDKSLTGPLIRGLLSGLWGVHTCSAESSGQADRIRAFVKQALLSMNRYEYIDKLLEFAEPDYSADNWLVLDRYFGSGLSYGHVDGLPIDYLVNIHKSLPQPSLSILIDIPVDESFRRRPIRQDSHESDRPFLENVRQAYLDLFKYRLTDQLSGHWHIVDGMGTPDEVDLRVQKIFNSWYSGELIKGDTYGQFFP